MCRHSNVRLPEPGALDLCASSPRPGPAHTQPFPVPSLSVRLVSLAAQRFIASLLDEAINVHKRRKLAPASQLKADGHNVRDKRAVLTTEELVEALKEVRRCAGCMCFVASHTRHFNVNRIPPPIRPCSAA